MSDQHDEVFSKAIAEQFSFNEDVAAVFDDMLVRSVPFYDQMAQLSIAIALRFLDAGDQVYDLGCSTASLLLKLEQEAAIALTLVGIDNAESMINQAKRKISAMQSGVIVESGDFLTYAFKPCKLFMAHYTMQFIRPIEREQLLRTLHGALVDDGIFLFSEKLISTHKRLNFEMTDMYYQFKRQNGYSQFEIAQKREALENVLVPYSEAENIELLLRAGFSHCEVLFRWNNFALFIAMK